MKFIKEKKIKDIIVKIILYISFCMSNWFMTRGQLASMVKESSLLTTILCNDITAFFIAGILPILLFELFTWFIFKFSQPRIMMPTEDLRYALRFFFIPANVILFLLKLLYIPFPYILGFGNILFDFVIFTAFMVLYMFYIHKNLVEKDKMSMVLYQIGGAYLIIMGIITLLTVLTGVLL